MPDEDRVAAKVAGYWLCPQCGIEKPMPIRHGWSSPWSPRKPDGSMAIIYCDEATDEEVARYRAWKANPGPTVADAKRTLAEWQAAQEAKKA